MLNFCVCFIDKVIFGDYNFLMAKLKRKECVLENNRLNVKCPVRQKYYLALISTIQISYSDVLSEC